MSLDLTQERDFDKGVGGGVDRDKLQSSDFVFPDERKFPIVTPQDVKDAVSSWGRYKGKHKGDFEGFQRRLKALAKRKGAKFVAALPDSWEEGRKPKKRSGPLTKKLEDGEHPQDHFLIVEDEEDVMTWHLCVKTIKGEYSMRLAGAAWAALTHPRGFRGNKFKGKGIRKAIAKLRNVYYAMGRKPPDERVNRRRADETMPGEHSLVWATFVPRIAEGDEFRGTAWAVTIIGADSPEDVVVADGREFVLSKNGRLYSADGLRESAPQWEGIKVYDNHLNPEEFKQRAGQRSVKDEWVGSLTQPHWVAESRRLDATLKIVDLVLAAKLKTAYEEDVLGQIGLSIDTYPVLAENMTVHEGQEMPVIEGFESIVSVDLVAEPAAGGRLHRILASVGADMSPQQEDNMNADEIRALVESILAEALPGQVAHAVEAAVAGLAPTIQEAVRAAVAEATGNEQEQEGDSPNVEQETDEETSDQAGDAAEALIARFERRLVESEQRARLAEDRIWLAQRLAEADVASLPPAGRTLVAQQFAEGPINRTAVDTFIVRTREAFAQADTTGRVSGAGTERRRATESVYDQRDKWEMALMKKMMWGSQWSNLATLENIQDTDDQNEEGIVTSRLPEAYRAWVRAGRPVIDANMSTRELAIAIMGGNPLIDHQSESITTGTLTSLMKNTINLRLAADYYVQERWWDPIVRTETVTTIEDATLVRLYGLATLDEVAEGGPYTQLSMADEEETASYFKRGNTVGITLEALLKDRMNKLRQIPQKLAAAWYNTLSDMVSATFTVNTAAGPVLADTGALFNATATTTAGGHANLGTTALSGASFDAARLAMNKQTDRPLGAGRRLMIEPEWLLIPIDLRATARQVFESQLLPGSGNNDVNPHYQMVKPLVVPTWTDTNNWALVANPQQWPAIWLLFLSGMQTPAVFTAGDESSGSMFSNDTLLYKIRQIAFRYSSTYDCAPIADPRPLYKANVT